MAEKFNDNRRPSMQDRMKVFQNTQPSSGAATSPSSLNLTDVVGSSGPHSSHSGRSGETHSGRNKEESAARERRKETRHQTSPVHGQSTSRPRSAGASGQSSSLNVSAVRTSSTGQPSSLNVSASKTAHQGYQATTNPALQASFGLPSTTGQTGLTVPHVTSQTGHTRVNTDTSNTQSESGQSRFLARTSAFTQHGTSSENSQFSQPKSTKPARVSTITVSSSNNRPRTSPQQYHVEVGGAKEESVVGDKGVGSFTPAPPPGQRPADSAQTRHNRLVIKSKPGVQQEETVVNDPRTTSALPPKYKPPVVPNHAIRTVKDASRDSLQESPPTSPLYSGGISSGGLSSDQSQDGPYRQLTHPQQVNSMDCSTKIPGTGGHKSLPVDPHTGRSADSTQVLRLRSQPSNSSEDSDRVVGLEDSFPIHLLTGEQKPSDSILANLRDENDRLRREIEEKDKMIALSSALSEEFFRSGEDTASGSLPDFPSGPESHGPGEEGGGANVSKMVGTRGSSSLLTDDKGTPVLTGSKLLPQHEQNLHKKIDELKAHLAVKQTEIDTLVDQNASKESTIDVLKKTVEKNKTTAQRGIRGTDVDDYLDQVMTLTSQISDMEETDKLHRQRITELEQQHSKLEKLSRMARRLFEENKQFKSQVQDLEGELAEEKTLQASQTSEPFSPREVDTRALSIEALKVPQLEAKVKELQGKLKDAEGNQQAVKDADDRVMEKVTELSQREADIQSLKAKVDKLTEENITLSSNLKTTPPSPDDPSLHINSEAYQLLLQESQAKDNQLEVLKTHLADQDMLHQHAIELGERKTELELKCDELKVKSQEIGSLQRRLEHVDKLNNRLREHVKTLTVPTLIPGQEGDHPGTGSRNETENLQRSSPVLSGSGTERGKNKEELAEMNKANEQQRLHILELEQKIEVLELGDESLRIEMEKGQAHIDKLTRDHIGVVEHSKRQSKKVLEYKDRLTILEEQQKDFEAELEVATKQNNVLLADKSHLDGAFRKLTADKAKLATEVKTLRDKGQKFARTELEELEKAYKESQERISHLEKDLTRIRRERDLHKEKSGNLEEIERTCNHYQQMAVGQQAMLENLQKDLGDSRRKVTQLTSGMERQQTEFQQVTRQRDEVLGELEAHRLTAQTFQEDFQAERQDREKAHSKAAEMEQRFNHQIQALANELQQKAKENEAVQQALANQKRQFEVQMSSLNYQVGQNKEQGGRLQAENRKLQEEIQSKTQQVKQYKKQVDQFRVEVEASKEQAEVHRIQVETSVMNAESLTRENDRLRRDNDNLNARLRHAGATSVDPRQSPISDQLKRENEDLQRQAVKYMETINELSMRSGLLQSELEDLKKGRGVAPPQALPNHPRISEPLRQQIVNRPILPSQGAIRPSYQPPPHINQPSHQPHTGQPSQPSYPFVSQHHSHTSHQPHPPSSHQGQLSHAQRQQFQQSKALSVDDSHLHSRGTHQNNDQNNGRFLQTGREQPRYVDNSRLSASDSHSYRHRHTADLSLSTNVARANNLDNRFNTGNLLDGTRSPSSNADIRTPAGQLSRTNQPSGTNADSAVRNPPVRPLPSSENPNRYPVYDNLPLSSGFGPQGPASLPLSAALGSPSPTHDRQAIQYGGGNGFQKQQLGQMHGRPGEGNPQQHQTPDIVDKDSPPASYQPSSLNIQQGNQLRAQFAGKPQGMTKSADGYLQPSSAAAHARPQQARPLPTPRVQVDYGSGGPPYPGGAGRQLQGYQTGQGGQLGGGNVSYYNPPRAVSAHVKYPQQESRVELGPEQSRERLPAPLRLHSQNVYNPQMQGGRVGGRYIQKDMPGMGTHVEENSQNSGESSLESNQSNALDKGIDQDIKQAAKKLEKQVSGEESMAIEGDSVPFDPNLVCPYCQKRFRLGEIQKFRRHADSCDRKR